MRGSYLATRHRPRPSACRREKPFLMCCWLQDSMSWQREEDRGRASSLCLWGKWSFVIQCHVRWVVQWETGGCAAGFNHTPNLGRPANVMSFLSCGLAYARWPDGGQREIPAAILDDIFSVGWASSHWLSAANKTLLHAVRGFHPQFHGRAVTMCGRRGLLVGFTVWIVWRLRIHTHIRH